MGKSVIIQGSVECWKHSTDTTDNLIMAGSGNEHYTTNNTSCYPLPSKSEGFIVLEHPSKSCTKCGTDKSFTDFHKDNSRSDGLHSICKECRNKDRMLNYKPLVKTPKVQPQPKITQPTTVNKWCSLCEKWLSRDNFNIHNKLTGCLKPYCKVCSNEVSKKSAIKNRAKRTAAARIWTADNKDRVNRKSRENYKNNPDRFEANRSKRRAMKSGSGGFHTPEQWQWIKFTQNFTCLKCGRKEPEIKLTVDHIIPISKGGTDNIGNIQGLCRTCNSSKGTKFIDLRTIKKIKKVK